MTLDELNDLDPKLVAVMALGLWEGDYDSDGVPCTYKSSFHCDECDHTWDMEWTCACDDDCFQCGGTYSPDFYVEWDFDANDWSEERQD